MGNIDSLKQLIDVKKTIVGLDAYGVIYNQSGVFEKAKKVIEYCQSNSVPVYVLTNNATQSLIDISNSLHRMGISIAPECIVSSGVGCYLLPTIKQQLEGRSTFVYGYKSSIYYAKKAGGIITDDVEKADAIVMAASTGSNNHTVYHACFKRLKNNPSINF